jgi:DNA-binding ferritin-like protein
MRLTEAHKIFEEFQMSSRVQEAIFATLSMVTQTHLWHWQTRSYAEHETLGNYYEFLQEKVDELAEIYLGSGAGGLGALSHDTLKDYSNDAAKQAIKRYKEQLARTQREIMDSDDPNYDSIGDTMLDLVKESDKVLYQLELS